MMASVRGAVLAQDELSQDICPVPCSTLVSHHCQVCSRSCSVLHIPAKVRSKDGLITQLHCYRLFLTQTCIISFIASQPRVPYCSPLNTKHSPVLSQISTGSCQYRPIQHPDTGSHRQLPLKLSFCKISYTVDSCCSALAGAAILHTSWSTCVLSFQPCAARSRSTSALWWCFSGVDVCAVQIVSVAKWRGSQIAEVVQGTGAHAWVQLADLAASSYSITLAQVLLSCTQHQTLGCSMAYVCNLFVFLLMSGDCSEKLILARSIGHTASSPPDMNKQARKRYTQNTHMCSQTLHDCSCKYCAASTMYHRLDPQAQQLSMQFQYTVQL